MLLRLTDGHYLSLLRRYLPDGPIWPRSGDDSLSKLLHGLAAEFARVHGRGLDCLDEFDPRTATDTIGEWMRLVGVPNDCVVTVPATLAEKRALATAIYAARGGQSAAYFVAVAADLGVVATVDDHPYGLPFRAGYSRTGDRLNTIASAFYWRVRYPAATPAATVQRLQCLVNKYKPAHTRVIFEGV